MHMTQLTPPGLASVCARSTRGTASSSPRGIGAGLQNVTRCVGHECGSGQTCCSRPLIHMHAHPPGCPMCRTKQCSQCHQRLQVSHGCRCPSGRPSSRTVCKGSEWAGSRVPNLAVEATVALPRPRNPPPVTHRCRHEPNRPAAHVPARQRRNTRNAELSALRGRDNSWYGRRVSSTTISRPAPNAAIDSGRAGR
jgi:hypothetical protein